MQSAIAHLTGDEALSVDSASPFTSGFSTGIKRSTNRSTWFLNSLINAYSRSVSACNCDGEGSGDCAATFELSDGIGPCAVNMKFLRQ